MKTEIKPQKEEETHNEEKIIRILSQDIEGKMTVYSGISRIKGVSWSLANAVCKILKIEKNRKIGSLTPKELTTITEFIKKPEKMPLFLFNRRSDFVTGEDKHLIGNDLDLQKDFDIKRLRQIKSYRGYRHALKLPLRGQRTKSNFRRNRGKGSGIKKKDKK